VKIYCNSETPTDSNSIRVSGDLNARLRVSSGDASVKSIHCGGVSNISAGRPVESNKKKLKDALEEAVAN